MGDTAQVASSLVLLSVDRNTRLQQRVSGHVQARLNRVQPSGAVRASGGDRLLCVSGPAVPTQKPQGGSRARQNRAQSGVPYCSIARQGLQKRSRMTTWVHSLLSFICERALLLALPAADMACALARMRAGSAPRAPRWGRSAPPNPLHLMLATK